MDGEGPGLRATLITTAPLALAIGVFGVVFGAAASATIDPLLVVAMSAVVFSGSLQFALVALLLSGAGVIALLVTTIVLNLRHVVFGAVLRPRIEVARWRRAVLSFFMIDESFGLALVGGKRATFVLAVSGVLCYFTWVTGTILGVVGARAVSLEEVSRAVFPILFIGLAAVTARGKEGMLRGLAAALIVFAIALVLPGLFDYAPIIAAIVVALPSRRTASRAVGGGNA
ncbi:MAG: AzlC family ABC transporter permease [Chloroflexota bacterium]|nr:AzlC family ABC transporter permease [Chloroflexota bacterium]